IIGATVVADYGFAKIVQLAQSSFLTLVDATKGIHSAEEPKTVTLALVSEEVEAWYEYLTRQGVTMHRALQITPGQAHDGFVALDPEGYFLEFERFNGHPENAQLLPRLAAISPTYPTSGETLRPARPAQLGITATVLWLYYQDIEAISRFYTTALGLEQVVDQGFARIYQTSPSGFLGPVIAGQGLHPYTEQKAATISLLTDDIDVWFERLRGKPQFRLRTEEIVTRDRYRAFVGYDPEDYFMEFNTFLSHPDNQKLLGALQPQD
ncbi:MAG: glyoxalase, partial [Chloroflexi bacterium]